MADQNEGSGDAKNSLAVNRSRRSRKDGARKAMLAKIKEAKSSGQRVKYEVKEVEDVYEEIDEYEYSKRVNKRLDEDWIVDDGVGGYYEDGLEVFDDERDQEDKMQSIDAESEGKKKGSSKRKVKMAKSKNIKNMLAGMGTKRKASEKAVALGNDELLGDILSEMSQVPESPSLSTPPPNFVLKKKRPNPGIIQPASKAIRRPRIEKPPPVKDFLSQQVTPPAKRPKPDLQLNEEDSFQAEDVPDQLLDCDDDENFPEVDARKEEKEQKTKMKPNSSVENPIIEQHLNWNHDAEEPLILNTDVVLSSNELPLVENKDGEKVLRFYWLDAHEEAYSLPDVCYLFGKVYVESVKAHVSCCLTVKNLYRTVYLLPRDKHLQTDDDIRMQDVYDEFNSVIADKYNIMRFKSKVVEKKNVFGDRNIPESSEYLEIRYPASHSTLPQDLAGSTFSHIFGSQRKPIETVLIEKNINGPCWLDIKLPQLNRSQISWCQIEAFVSSMVNISITSDPPEMPPLTVLTLTAKTLPNLKTHQNELLALSCLIHYNFRIDKPAPKPLFQKHFCAISKPSDCVYPYDLRDVIKKSNMEVEVTGSERALLTYFLAKIKKIDPDVIIGHGVVDFDLDVLLHRITACKVLHWSRIGRLKRLYMPKFNSHGHTMDRAITCGRVLCDVKIMAKELIRCKSYDLDTLADIVLHKPRKQLPMEQYKNMFNSSKSLMWLIEHTCIDANASLSIACELNVLPLALQITTIAGNVLSRTLLGGRAERNEFLLLHAFHQRGFLAPEKVFKKKEPKSNDPNGTTTTSRRSKKAAYAGGLVLEPKKGFYDKYILLLDFNSLYPSIIQEYNICFTTIDRYPKDDKVDEESFIPDVPEPGMEAGVLPTEIRKLVDRRRQVKNLMKGSNVPPEQMTQYDIRQKALKLTANSMYGCLGFSNSRFYAKPLAALVTMMGREILMQTKELAERMNLEVIYGDTDSIMINTNSCDIDQVFRIGQQVKSEVNKLYKLLEIDIDGVYKSMLLLKKKKYAALSVTKNADGTLKTTQEMKGLDIVRRDWSELAKLAGSYSVSQILSDQPRETIVDNIHTKLQEMADKVKKNNFLLSVYEINKELTRDPSEYRQKVSLPHVLVASRLNQKMLKHLKAGDIVSYIICDDSTSNPATQRGYTISEIEASNGDLKVDVQYYLSQQVHPVVMRLCDPIDGTDSEQIAQCLGLDPTSYRSSRSREEDDENSFLLLQTNEQERFSECEPLVLSLPNDETVTLKSGVFAETEPSWTSTLQSLQQTNSDGKSLLPRIQNQVTMAIRNHINKYYQNWLLCDDNLCGHRTRRVPVAEDQRDIPCSVCERGTLKPEYPFKLLYTQLCYYKLQFDVEYALKKYKQNTAYSPGLMNLHNYRQGYEVLLASVNKYLHASAYSQVSLSELFGRL